MVSKTKRNRKKYINAEKYILTLLIIFYIAGVSSGCYFVLSSNENAYFVNYVLSDNSFKIFLYFFAAFLLKYSGIFSGGLYILLFFLGIQNSVSYCNMILNREDIFYDTILNILKDTSVTMLLILYIIIIVSQLINKKFNLKKDIKYLSVYIIGVSVILSIEFIINKFIF